MTDEYLAIAAPYPSMADERYGMLDRQRDTLPGKWVLPVRTSVLPPVFPLKCRS